jgi:hypothetical protein
MARPSIFDFRAMVPERDPVLEVANNDGIMSVPEGGLVRAKQLLAGHVPAQRGCGEECLKLRWSPFPSYLGLRKLTTARNF